MKFQNDYSAEFFDDLNWDKAHFDFKTKTNDEGLTLETSAPKLFTATNLRYHLSW